MTSASSNLTSFPAGPQPFVTNATRPLRWAIRRELWENRSLYLAPLIVATLLIVSFTASLRGFAERRAQLLTMPPQAQLGAILLPFDGVALVLLATSFLLSLFYCVDALYGERRDRSVLFWKSLPVSDRTAVLAKGAIPMVVLPAITFVVIVATHVAMLLAMSIALAIGGVSPSSTWAHLNFFLQPLILLYGIVANALWHAPLFGWLLLVSAWAKRAVFVWATVPLLAFGILERMFNDRSFLDFLRGRVVGAIGLAFEYEGQGSVVSLAQLTPWRFLTSPALWGGLAFAAGCLALAIRVRKRHEPV